jgi:S-disulfanyl-L-cysteine oxidoreductase SoxD
MASLKFLVLAALLVICGAARAQSPTYHLGRTPTPEEIRSWDIAISPVGTELPEGYGTAKEGEVLYRSKGCAGCHGAAGSGAHAPTLIARKDVQSKAAAFCLAPCVNDSNAMAIHSPFATTIWDYINRGMPLGKEGSLSPNEVYALTAFILYRNNVIKEDEVMNKQSLAKVKMPNHDGFALPPAWKHGEPRLQGYP